MGVVSNNIDPVTIKKGDNIDFSQGVTISDNRDPNPTLNIDASKVDLKTVGTYYVTYTGIDRSNNQVTLLREVKVIVADTSNNQSNEKIVNLTFDDGPSNNTAKILDILAKYNIKATLFVTGNNQNYNYLIKQAHDAGHTIALHTYSHDYQKVYRSVGDYFDDLYKLSNMVNDLIGHHPKYVRFPGGSSNTVSRKYCPGIMTTLVSELTNRGYQYYDWNVNSSDASGNNVPVDKIIASSTTGTYNNINILFHDTSAKSTTVTALPSVIEHYLEKGYRFEAINDSSFAPHQRVNN